ncbi:MAG: DUF2577 domain-containing protein [Tissierella sp.]|nr:DUF2577 domain-containing protein [Tissierella sp.]
MEAVEESSPMGIAYGVVTKISPLEINVEQRMNIGGDMLIPTSNVIDKVIEIKIGNGSRETMIIYNGLSIGEKVLLLRENGGQKYIVLDRLVSG